MPTNRYTNLSWGNLNDLPIMQLPFEALQGVLSASQQAKDQFDELSGLTPKYIQNSPSDVKLAGTVKQYQNDVAAQLAEIAQSGDANKYRRELSNAKRNIVKMWQPGGAANALETRYQQWAENQKRTEEDFKNNRRVGQYVLGSHRFNDIGYNAGQGTYNNINSPTYHRDVEEKEINEWFNKNLDNVKDSLLSEGYSRKQIDGITSIHDFWQTEGVPFNKLVETFTNLFPDEYKNSIYQRETAERYYNPNLPEMSSNMFQVEEKDGQQFIKTDKKGRYMLDTNNPIGRMIQGYSQLGERENIKHDRKVIDDKGALEAMKHSYRKKEIDHENQMQTSTMMTRLMNNNNAMPEMKINPDGTLYTEMPMSEALEKGYFKGGSYSYSNFLYKGEPKNKSFGVNEIMNGKAESQFPGVTSIYDKFKDEDFFQKLSDNQKSQYIAQQYNNLREQMQTFDVAMDIPTGKNADKMSKTMQYQVVGEKGAWGLMGQAPLQVYSPTKGINGEIMSVEKLAEKAGYGTDVEEFQKAARWTSTIRADNPAIPSGHHVHVKHKKSGELITVLVSPESVQLNEIKTPAYVGNAPRFNPAEESDAFITKIPEIDNFNGGPIFTKRETVFPSDQVQEVRRGIENAYARGEAVYDDKGNKISSLPQLLKHVEKFETARQDLLRNPTNNKPTIRLGVYNANTKERIGGQEVWDAINNQIEARARNYGKE